MPEEIGPEYNIATNYSSNNREPSTISLVEEDIESEDKLDGLNLNYIIRQSLQIANEKSKYQCLSTYKLASIAYSSSLTRQDNTTSNFKSISTSEIEKVIICINSKIIIKKLEIYKRSY